MHFTESSIESLYSPKYPEYLYNYYTELAPDHPHTASPPQSWPWCPWCDALLTAAIILDEIHTSDSIDTPKQRRMA